MNRRTFLSTSLATLAAGAAIPRALADGAFQKADGMAYAPRGKPNPVVGPGEFVFAAVHLDHGHINGMTNGLLEAGATLRWVYDPDPAKVSAFQRAYPQAKAARSLDEVLGDPDVRLVACAAISNLRGPIGCRVMEAGRDYFSDKPPFTTLEQLAEARATAARTGRKFMVYYAERLHNEAAMAATDLVADGAVGRVIQVVNLAPHRLNRAGRPAWFFNRAEYGGILCDLGSHQFEQFLAYSGAKDATVARSSVGNFANMDKPELEDFGDACLVGDNGAVNYVRVDWFTPAGLGAFGDGRTFILGTTGTIELRKYVDLARDPVGDHVYIADQRGERHLAVSGKVGYRFFGELILDCLHRTEHAMTQAHAFKAAEVALRAQAQAVRLSPLA